MRSLYIFTALVAAATSTVLEKLDAVPQGWVKVERAPAEQNIKFRIALKQENAWAFEQHVIDISTPDHPLYGQHMSHEELKRALRPSADATDTVLDWLYEAGIADVEDDGDWIQFVASVGEAEELLDTEFNLYENAKSKSKHIRTLQYSVPDSVRLYIQMIQPTIRFGQPGAHASSLFKVTDLGPVAEFQGKYSTRAPVNNTFCNTTITPDCLRFIYKIGNFQGSPNDGNSLGIAGYLNQYAKYADLSQFLKAYTTLNPAQNNFTYVTINGGGGPNDQDSPLNDVEANLDVQYAIGLGARTKPDQTIYFSTAGNAPLVPDLDQPAPPGSNEPYLDFLHYILAQPDSKIPKVITTSYGEDEQSVPASYTNATCSLFAQLGARGVSVLFSSGDTGVGSACQTNDGKNTTRFLPIFPAACPFVTSVGGTYHVAPERAIAFSSGGFSDRFPRPAYQDRAVKEYLARLGSTWKGLYNPNGRGFPDVAAQSYNFTVIDRGNVIKVAGTSASSPAFAGVVALLNSARLGVGRKPLGFLNPWIYSLGYRGLNDIVDGGSKGCTGTDAYSGLPTPFVPHASWNATKGWDPVTGYGTPNFPILLPLALAK